MSSTRTSSPYFSPNSIIAPSLLRLVDRPSRAPASAWFARISALTSSSTSRICVVGHRRVVGEVEARLVGVDQRALLLHVLAQHLAQRLVHQVRRRCGCAWSRARRSASTLRGDARRRPSSVALDDARRGGRTRRPGSYACPRRTNARALGVAQLAGVADLAAATRRRTACGRARRRRRRRPSARSTGVPST